MTTDATPAPAFVAAGVDDEPVTVVVTRRVKPGREAAYEAWLGRLIDGAAAQIVEAVEARGQEELVRGAATAAAVRRRVSTGRDRVAAVGTRGRRQRGHRGRCSCRPQ